MMANPFVYFLKAQQTAVEGMAAWTRAMADGYLRLFEQQQKILIRGFTPKRCEDADPKPKPTPPAGADLQDHYGRRAHDIDVERDV